MTKHKCRRMFVEWRPIVQFEDCYEISELGDVRSIQRIATRRNRWGGMTNRILQGVPIKPILDGNGYPKVMLCRNGARYFRFVHRLVCQAFHGPAPAPNSQAAHNDGNPNNPTATNVRWATPQENARDKIAHGTVRSGVENGNAKLTKEQVSIIRGDNGMTHSELAAQFGVARSTISMISSGRNWRA